MDFKEQFEKPLPVINREPKEIYIETSNSYQGFFVIKNDGGGLLEGRITSNSRLISFEPEKFRGNAAKIMFYVNLEIYNPGEIFRTSGLILSNGGEHQIEFIIKIIPHSIDSKDGEKISSLEDFRDYAEKHPVAARQLFTNHEFMMWMHSCGCEYMDLYERFITDSNKERALDNFLILYRLKERAILAFEGDEKTVNLPPLSNKLHKSYVNVKKTGWGYADEEISSLADWLTLGKSRLVSHDFDEEGNATLDFTIDPLKLNRRVTFGKILLGDKSLTVKAVVLNFVNITIERQFLAFRDGSKVIVTNNTGESLNVTIVPKDSFVKLEGTNYSVASYAEIPFEVDYPVLSTARLNLTRQPVAETELLVETFYGSQRYSRVFNLKIGNFL